MIIYYSKDYKPQFKTEFERVKRTRIVNKQKIITYYYNVPIAFDIETSSFYDADGNKRGCMYEWTFGITDGDEDVIIIGRTWDEFLELYYKIVDYFNLDDDTYLIIWCHNLAFEFQWIKDLFNWRSTFCLDERKPVQCRTVESVEFRCSYQLSGYALANLHTQLVDHNIKKDVGDLDYDLIRHSKTPLTNKELKYCIDDVRVVLAYISERIKYDGNITKIPLTKTGYVRKFLEKKTLRKQHKKDYGAYHYYKMMRGLTLETDEYLLCTRAFAGGFTHTCNMRSGKVYSNVSSKDFTSDYPACEVLYDGYPMGKGECVDITSYDDFKDNINYYACIFDITLYNVQEKNICEHYISKSKCWELENAVVDNGRVVSADKLSISITNIDWHIIRALYSYDEDFEIGLFYRYARGHLPKRLIEGVLSLYKDKTTLKGVEGRELDYLISKGNLNANFGNMVMNPCRDSWTYDGEWRKSTPDLAESLDKYNNSQKRFTFYPWGIFICAFARKRLFEGILECTDGCCDYIYADTDSCKIMDGVKHQEWFDKYNDDVINSLKSAMKYYKLPYELCSPKSIDGVEHPLGVWDDDGHYKRFKTLGAKRYMVETDKGISITVAGLNKKVATPYICTGWSYSIDGETEYNSPFDKFNDDLYVPAEYTGKKTHTYIDDPIEGDVTDYNGVTQHYSEKSAIHLEGTDYTLSLADDYIKYLKGVVDISF